MLQRQCMLCCRNICQHCKCQRELHDLYHEDFVNIRDRIGWGSPTDPALQVNREKTLKMGYTWVPPGLSKEKVLNELSSSNGNLWWSTDGLEWVAHSFAGAVVCTEWQCNRISGLVVDYFVFELRGLLVCAAWAEICLTLAMDSYIVKL